MLLVTVNMDRRAQVNKKPSLNWRKANWTGMRDDLASTDWSTTREQPVEERWKYFRKRISETVSKHVPHREVRSRTRPAWLTQQIMAAVRRKQRLWKRAKKGRDVEEYEATEKEVKRLIRNAKRNFVKDLLEGMGGTVVNSMPMSSRRQKASLALVP
jgi:hypothetical protein